MIVLPERANPRDEATPTPTSARARQAQVSVRELFAGSFLGLPLTHLARTAWPAPELGVRVRGPWHYWWQAHYLDCIVDAGWRELADRPERPDVAASLIRDAARLVRTIRLRNGWRIINSYYDDMAWLALALERFGDLVAARDRSAGRLAAMTRVLRDQVASAESDDLGGGVFWHTARSFKNVPATAPAAILLARAGEFARARQHIDWIHERLLDPATGLILDGIELERADHPPVTSIWTYNQGTVLGALAALASGPQSRPEDANRAAALVDVVARELCRPTDAGPVARTEGGADSGLFTGILLRYLAVVAVTAELPDRTRDLAAAMVRATAEAFWQGRRTVTSGRGRPCLVLPTRTDGRPDPEGPVELSTQLQAWMALEAAAALDRLDAAGVG